MKKCWIGWIAWLLAAGCLYFFENNTGTRIVLACSLLIPLLPSLRTAFFSPDAAARRETEKSLTVKAFMTRESEDAGETRPYRPGDPVRRIHWKLSARTEDILVREAARESETEETERTAVSRERGRSVRQRTAAGIAAAIALCLALLAAIPAARLGTQALLNRVFAESEKVNAYSYFYYPVSDGQDVRPAAGLILCAAALLIAETVILRSRLIPLLSAIACAVFQVYFGLSFPVWVHILCFALLEAWMIRRPFSRRELLICWAVVLVVSALTAVIMPGSDTATETASEAVRDRLGRTAGESGGTEAETAAGETETRHTNTRSIETGDMEAQTAHEYRLETQEEEQISIPHPVDYLKIITGLLLTAAVVILPFLPFALLSARRRKARENRKAFESENVGDAVTAIFRQVIVWLETTRHSGGNRLYRDWQEILPGTLPENYTELFIRSVRDYEEAVYSGHTLPEEKRSEALRLLKETEEVLWQEADWKTRLRLKYWMCLCE